MVHRDDDFIYFEALDASHTSKYLGLTLTLITIVITTPMMFNIVYFVTNCHFRTLVNRLIGFEFTITIIWNFTVNFTSVIRYLSGPFPIILCQLEYLNKNVMTMTLILLINIILIIRYIFIFKSKNMRILRIQLRIPNTARNQGERTLSQKKRPVIIDLIQ